MFLLMGSAWCDLDTWGFRTRRREKNQERIAERTQGPYNVEIGKWGKREGTTNSRASENQPQIKDRDRSHIQGTNERKRKKGEGGGARKRA